MAENLPNLKERDIKIQEAQRASNKLNPNRPIPRHIIIKMAKVKDKGRILKAARKKTKKIIIIIYIIIREFLQGYQLIYLQKHYRPEQSGKIYSKC